MDRISLTRVVALGSKLIFDLGHYNQQQCVLRFGDITEVALTLYFQSVNVAPEVADHECIRYTFPEEFSCQALQCC
jgi:hypothetical protein